MDLELKRHERHSLSLDVLRSQHLNLRVTHVIEVIRHPGKPFVDFLLLQERVKVHLRLVLDCLLGHTEQSGDMLFVGEF